MKVILRTLSPIHIGGREQRLSPLEYVISEGRCFIMNEDRLSEDLLKRGKLTPFLNQVQREGRHFDLEVFLRRNGLVQSDFLSSNSSYSSGCPVDLRRDLRPFIRDGFSRPYIPGSAIKGVIRTSLLYVILDRLHEGRRKQLLDDFVEGKLREFKRDPRGQRGFRWFQERFKQWFAQRLDQEIFQKFEIRTKQRGYDPHSDILRAIKVSDSTPVGKEEATVEEIKIFSVAARESPKRWSIYAECIPENTDFQFELKVDQGILSDFAKMNVDTKFGLSFSALSEIISNPLEAVRRMTEDLYKHESEFFRSGMLPPEALQFDQMPNFRIGWGIGLLGTSVDLLLPEKIRQDLRNTLFTERGDTPAPKSRRLIVERKGKIRALGWGNIGH